MSVRSQEEALAECEHIYGTCYGVDESWLLYDKERDAHYVEALFKYCPKCGEQLNDEYRE